MFVYECMIWWISDLKWYINLFQKYFQSCQMMMRLIGKKFVFKKKKKFITSQMIEDFQFHVEFKKKYPLEVSFYFFLFDMTTLPIWIQMNWLIFHTNIYLKTKIDWSIQVHYQKMYSYNNKSTKNSYGFRFFAILFNSLQLFSTMYVRVCLCARCCNE